MARWGPYFWRALSKRVETNPQFEFLRVTSGKMLSFFRGLVGIYHKMLHSSEKPSMAVVLNLFFQKVELSTVSLHAFVGGVDCLAYMEDRDYSIVMPRPERLSMVVDRLKDEQPPLVSDTPFSGYTLDRLFETSKAAMEICIINLTAQFVARYGPYFCRELKKAVDKKPQFLFMNPTDILYSFYSGRVNAYSKVFMRLTRLGGRRRNYVTAATVLEVFFQRLQLEKLEEGDETAMIDLHAFLGGFDCLAGIEEDEDEEFDHSHSSLPRLVLERIRLCNAQRPLGSQLTENQGGVEDIHECDVVQPVLDHPIWDPPLRRTNLVICGPLIKELTLKEIVIIKLTAQFAARYGPFFCRDLLKTVDKNSQFKVMHPHGTNFDFYNGLAGAYATVLRRSKKLVNSDAPTGTVLERFFHHLQLGLLEEGVEMAIDDFHAFVGGVDCFAYMENEEYSSKFPPPEPLSVRMNRLTQMQPPLGSRLIGYLADQNQDGDQGIPASVFHAQQLGLRPPPPFRDLAFGFIEMDTPLKEHGVIKFTAQFVARYGYHFLLALIKRERKNPQFEFLKPTGSSSYIWFNMLVRAYSRVLRTSDLVSDASIAETFIEIFLQLLQLDKLEEGDEKAVINLHAFVGGVDCFADMEDEEYTAYLPPPENFSVMMNRLTHMQPGHRRPCNHQLVPPSAGMMQPAPSMPGMSPRVHEEPEPKRQKF